MWTFKKQKGVKQFQEKDIPKLRYGMIHCRFGDTEGVSIVMKQVEQVLNKNLDVPRKNVYYLVGTSGVNSKQITRSEWISEKHPINELALKNYNVGYGGGSSEQIEFAINQAKRAISEWVRRNRIDVLIAHNTSHPVNFIFSIALSRYYRDAIKENKPTPKYVLWWHDSHLERKHFENPARDVENYLLQGVPGNYVEYTLFINSLQFNDAKKYFKKLDQRNKGFYKDVRSNHDVMYNTTDTFISSFKDLEGEKYNESVEMFMNDFKVKEFLQDKRLNLSNTLFCLQHTRMVKRKRIDFALKYAYELFSELKKKGKYKAMYFFVSGRDSGDGSKKEILKLNKELKKQYKLKNFFLVFAEDNYDKTSLTFEEYPKIFAKLGAISTYFSDIEGFGNNLLEVLASGLVPAVYTYPVYKKDIAKYKFKTIAFDKFELDSEKIKETIALLNSNKKRKQYVDYNLKVLEKHFPHSTIAVKLKQAILSQRSHI